MAQSKFWNSLLKLLFTSQLGNLAHSHLHERQWSKGQSADPTRSSWWTALLYCGSVSRTMFKVATRIKLGDLPLLPPWEIHVPCDWMACVAGTAPGDGRRRRAHNRGPSACDWGPSKKGSCPEAGGRRSPLQQLLPVSEWLWEWRMWWKTSLGLAKLYSIYLNTVHTFMLMQLLNADWLMTSFHQALWCISDGKVPAFLELQRE